MHRSDLHSHSGENFWEQGPDLAEWSSWCRQYFPSFLSNSLPSFSKTTDRSILWDSAKHVLWRSIRSRPIAKQRAREYPARTFSGDVRIAAATGVRGQCQTKLLTTTRTYWNDDNVLPPNNKHGLVDSKGSEATHSRRILRGRFLFLRSRSHVDRFGLLLLDIHHPCSRRILSNPSSVRLSQRYRPRPRPIPLAPTFRRTTILRTRPPHLRQSHLRPR